MGTQLLHREWPADDLVVWVNTLCAHEHKAAAIVNLVLGKDRENLRILQIYFRAIGRVHLVNLHARLIHDPLGSAPMEPLRTAVRPQAYDRIEADLFDGGQPGIEIKIVAEAQNATLWFMRVPKDVALDRVYACALGLYQPFAPLFTGKCS